MLIEKDLLGKLLPKLLEDKTTGKNIVLATDSYADLGEAFLPESEITADVLKSIDLRPRVLKSLEEQAKRTRQKAEVFTPTWVCCKMNNTCDEEWFGRPDVFNHLDDRHWETTAEVVMFPEGKTWQEYVDSPRLEITCGEAPFIVSRYDAATGEEIEINRRIGMLDRKLRVVNENTVNRAEWLEWALRAFKSVYGYEWQGDSLLIARINLLMTFVENHQARWGDDTTDQLYSKAIFETTEVVAWNFWQMDGLTGRVPYGQLDEDRDATKQITFFDLGWEQESAPKPVGKTRECLIYDWQADKPIKFNSLKQRR